MPIDKRRKTLGRRISNKTKEKQKNGATPHMSLYVAGITLFFLLYEIVKTHFLYNISMNQSHGISVLVVFFLSTFFIARFRNLLYERNQELVQANKSLNAEIVQRKTIEKSLRESEHILRVSQKIANLGSYVIHLDERVIEYSQESCKILGIDQHYPHELDSFIALIHPAFQKMYLEYLSYSEQEQENFEFEYQIKKADIGQVRWVYGFGSYDTSYGQGGRHIVCTIQDITDRKEKEEENFYLSYHDQLTGLYNRRFYEEELKRLDSRRNLPFTVIMGDVNGLKLTNDSFGHAAGDELLIKAAGIIKSCFRVDDIIARIGGDEFVVLLPQVDSDEAEEIIKRIQTAALQEKVKNLPISISFGYETKRSEEEKILQVIKSAEDHMYKKKIFENLSLRGKSINAILATLYEKNKREEAHSHRVGELCMKMGEALRMNEYEKMELKTVGLFHDIGKVAIHEDILNKSESLSNEEWEAVQRHAEIGYRILSTANDMADIAGAVLAHHERWNGSGYPRHLRGDEIPLSARIVAIVDTYDAVTGESYYQKSRSSKEAIELLKMGAGTEFDPELVVIFANMILEEQEA